MLEFGSTFFYSFPYYTGRRKKRKYSLIERVLHFDALGY
jgi:hypothetical protein